MAKRQTKADAILNDAAMRLEAARIRERTAQSEWNAATAALVAHKEAYDALEQALVPKPRKKPVSTSPAQPTLPTDKIEKTSDDAGPKCGLCGNPEDYQDHYQPSPHYHAFEVPKSVASAGKRSSRKGAPTSSTVNSEIEKAAAMSAGGD